CKTPRGGRGGESLYRSRIRATTMSFYGAQRSQPMATGDVDDVSAALLRHVTDDALREVKEAIQVHGGHRGEVVVGVVQERFADEDPSVVDQRVDAAETVERLLDDALGGLDLRNVALDCVHVDRVRRGYRKRGRHDAVAETKESSCDSGSNPLRSAGDDRHLPRLGRRRHPTRYVS